MMESIIRNHIVVHMSGNNSFPNEQHGFVPRRECITNLLSAMEDWSEAIELGLDVIYTDFAKAFDSVPHKQLSLTLKANGIEGGVLKWIQSFLTGRRHIVCADGELSDWIYVTSGIPEGSVLGPILFVIFINDMPKVIKNYCKLFADDAKLYARITCKDDNASLQEDI